MRRFRQHALVVYGRGGRFAPPVLKLCDSTSMMGDRRNGNGDTPCDLPRKTKKDGPEELTSGCTISPKMITEMRVADF